MWKATPIGDAVLSSFFLTNAAVLPVQQCRAPAGLNLVTSASTPQQSHDRPPAHTRRRLSGTPRRATSLCYRNGRTNALFPATASSHSLGHALVPVGD